MEIEVTINNRGNRIEATIAGHLDTVAAQQLAHLIQPLVDDAQKEIEIDCSGMDYVCSTCLREFLRLRKSVAQKGGSLVLKTIPEAVRNVFVITGFYNLFTIKS